MSDCWPHLTQDGWGPRQLKDLKPIFERKGYEPEAIPMSMNYMEYILSQGIELKDKDGNLVKKPYAYLFGILKQDGIFKRPEGYIDPALLYKEQKLADEKAKRALEEELLQQELAREASNIFNNGPGDELFDQAFLKIPKTHQAWYQHGQKTVIVKKSLTVQIEKLLLGE